MNKSPKITVCSKACSECGFTKDGTTDTLYNEAFDIIKNAIVFPCHMYLKSKTGSENQGTETLDEVKVCRGYVAFMLKNYKHILTSQKSLKHSMWIDLVGEINKSELDNICTPEELNQRHIGLRNKINISLNYQIK